MKRLLLIATAVMAFALPNAIQAQKQGYYLEGHGGINLLQKRADHGVSKDFDTGYLVGASGGYAFCHGFRYEVEISYRRNAILRLDVDDATLDVKGHFSTLSLMANAFYEFDICCSVKPYIGMGIGYANSTEYLFTAGSWFKDHDTAFASQLIAGVTYPLWHDQVDLALDYRFFRAEYAPADNNHSIVFGLKYYF